MTAHGALTPYVTNAHSMQGDPHVRKPPMKIFIEDWDGDGAIRIPDEALQELDLDVGDAVYLIEEFVGNTYCLVLSKKPQIADRMDELTGAWQDKNHD